MQELDIPSIRIISARMVGDPEEMRNNVCQSRAVKCPKPAVSYAVRRESGGVLHVTHV